MGQKTEAACLLETGALYTRRLGLKPNAGTGELAFAGFKHGAFSLFFGDEPIYHFDLEGRWQRAFIDGRHYLKSLDGSITAMSRIREGKNLVLHRQTLRFAEASDLDAQIRAEVLDLLEAINTGRTEPVEPPAPTRPIEADRLRAMLDRISQWDAAAWFAHRERYLATYAPFGFLPPEAQQSVILQAAVGDRVSCTFGKEAFAGELVLRTPAELEAHARNAEALWGRRALQCRWVYLAGSGVLSQSRDQIEGYLSAANAVFPIDRGNARLRQSEVEIERSLLSGIVVFLDRLDARLPDPAGWVRFREQNLTRVVIGVESGHAAVRDLSGKRWWNDTLVNLVATLKAAALEVSIVVLVGAGGAENAERHVAGTAETINALELGAGDLVYLIDVAEVGDGSSSRRLQDRGLTPLSAAAIAEQQAELLKALAPVRTVRKAKVVPYTTEKQLI